MTLSTVERINEEIKSALLEAFPPGKNADKSVYLECVSLLGSHLLIGTQQEILFSTELVLEKFGNTDYEQFGELELFKKIVEVVIVISNRDNEGKLGRPEIMNEFSQIIESVEHDKFSSSDTVKPMLDAMKDGISQFREVLLGQNESNEVAIAPDETMKG